LGLRSLSGKSETYRASAWQSQYRSNLDGLSSLNSVADLFSHRIGKPVIFSFSFSPNFYHSRLSKVTVTATRLDR